MKLCANLSWLFQELPFLERIPAARDAGFEGIEVLDPYDLNVQDVVSSLGVNKMQMVLFNCPPPNYAGGSPGWAAVPGSRFESDLRRALRYAKTLKAEYIHIMAGEIDRNEGHETFIENLKLAAATAPEQKFTIEPLNQNDRPGYFLSDYYFAKGIIDEVGAPNLGLQFDAYHAARIHGDVLKTWDAVKDTVTHVQVGQAPDRSEPSTLQPFFERLKSDGYGNWVSAEYQPSTSTLESLAWMKELT